MTPLATALLALDLTPALEDPILTFLNIFSKWNRSINLSAARSDLELRDHIVDCLHVIPHLRAEVDAASPPSSPARVLDVGSGGGLPVVIAAICLPGMHFTALEPVHKKHAFLRTASRELSLANLEPLPERIGDHLRHDYDAAMSRATFDLREWLLRGLAVVRPGGLILGFEAISRSDLPTGTRRHPYRLDAKSRSIVSLRRPA